MSSSTKSANKARGLLSRRSFVLAAASAGVACAADAWVVEPDGSRSSGSISRSRGWARGGRALRLPCCPTRIVDRCTIRRTSSMRSASPMGSIRTSCCWGDYVHRGGRYIAPGIAPFERLSASHGVFAVLGNHDHWDGTLSDVGCARARWHSGPHQQGYHLGARRRSVTIGGGRGLHGRCAVAPSSLPRRSAVDAAHLDVPQPRLR